MVSITRNTAIGKIEFQFSMTGEDINVIATDEDPLIVNGIVISFRFGLVGNSKCDLTNDLSWRVDTCWSRRIDQKPRTESQFTKIYQAVITTLPEIFKDISDMKQIIAQSEKKVKVIALKKEIAFMENDIESKKKLVAKLEKELEES